MKKEERIELWALIKEAAKPEHNTYMDDEEIDLDPMDEAAADCGMTEHGICGQAGSEYCEFGCPFNQ